MLSKKEETVLFLTDFRKINELIVCKKYPIPKIVDTLQQLEGSKYATVLDLNMGYYNILFVEYIKDITIIVTEFGKSIYTCLPMGTVTS